jgi:hypothetical protein
MEFQIDVLDPGSANDFMAGPAFDANPVGESFDPDELAARWRAHDDVTDLVLRSDQDRIPVPGRAGASSMSLAGSGHAVDATLPGPA